MHAFRDTRKIVNRVDMQLTQTSKYTLQIVENLRMTFSVVYSEKLKTISFLLSISTHLGLRSIKTFSHFVVCLSRGE